MLRKRFIAVASAAAAATALPARGSVVVPDFRYQSALWFNLHHTLFFHAYTLKAATRGTAQFSALERAAYDEAKTMLSDNDLNWNEALDTYRKNYAALDFVFDASMTNADNALATVGDSESSFPRAVPRPMQDALTQGAPAYRALLWQKHTSQNENLIVSLRTSIAPYDTRFASELTRIYQTPFLEGPYIVDVVAYTDWAGSYSNMGDTFVHIPISSEDPTNDGLSGVDVLFHEASHSIVDPQYGTIGSAITRQAKRLGRKPPDQFWHALIMYTPGKLAEQWFSRPGHPYTMVWIRLGLFTRVWPAYYAAFERHWFPYMSGRGTMDDAIAGCLRQIYMAGA